MMKFSKQGRIGIFFAFIVALFYLNGCASYDVSELQTPEIALVSVQPSGEMNLFEQGFDVGLRLSNPNNTAYHFKGMRYALELNEMAFARGASADHVSIPALGEETIIVQVRSGTLDWLRQFEQLRAKGFSGLTYKISGDLFLSENSQRSAPFIKEGAFTL